MARLLGLVWLTAAVACAGEAPTKPRALQPAGLMTALPRDHWAYAAVAWLGEAGMINSVPGWRDRRRLSPDNIAELAIAAGDSLDPTRQAADLLPSATLSVTRRVERRGLADWRRWWARQQSAADRGWSWADPVGLEAARGLQRLATEFSEQIAARGGHPEVIVAAAEAAAAHAARANSAWYADGRTFVYRR